MDGVGTGPSSNNSMPPAGRSSEQITVGTQLQLSFGACGGCGYSWSLSGLPNELENQVIVTSEPASPDEAPMPGASKKQVFTFPFLPVGHYELHFEYSRGATLAEESVVSLDVVPAGQ